MTDVGELVVRIKADAAELERELRRATQTTKESANQMAEAVKGVKEQFMELLPAITAVALVEFGKHAIETGASLYELSERTGASVEMLSALDVVLRQNGGSIEDLANGIKFMNRNVSEAAADPNGGLAAKFQQIGLNAKQLLQLSTDDRFKTIAQAISEFGNAADRTNLRLGLLGRGAENLGNTMDLGAAGINKATEEAKKLGLVLSEKQAHDLKLVNDEIKIFVATVERLAQVNLSGFVVGWQELAGYFSKSDNPTDYSSLYQIQGKVVALNSQKELLESQIKTAESGGSTWDKMFGDPEGDLDKARQKLADVNKEMQAFMGRYNELKKDREGGGGGGNRAGRTLPAINVTGQDKDPSLAIYISQLKDEADAANLSAKALFIKRAELEANTKAHADYVNGLRDSKEMTDQEKASVDAAASSLYDAKEANNELKHATDQVADSLAKAAVEWKGMGDAATSVIRNIAEEIIKNKITHPLVDSLSGLLPSFSGIGKLLGFADGGSPPVGVPSMVGENGPELFVPNQAGTIIPNGKMGGTTIQQTLVFNMSPGLPETVGAAIRASAPQIAAMAQANIMQAARNGGADSKILGLRS